MSKFFNRFLVLTIFCVLVTMQTSYANDIQRLQIMSKHQVVNLKPTEKLVEETYTPVAFAADLESIDKNVYQNKQGEIVICKSYVPDNY